MKRSISILFNIFILVGLGTGAWWWLQAFYDSAQNYQPPLSQNMQLPNTAVLPQTSNVVIVLLSGLGNEVFESSEWPNLEQLAQTGVSSAIQSLPPTYSQSARMTLVSGAWPELNGVAPIDQSIQTLAVAPAPSIFAMAHQAQLKTALVGLADWRELVPREHLNEIFFVDAPGFEADQTILNVTLPLLKDEQMDLILIQFTSLDFVADQLGGTSNETYRAAALRLDDYIGQISRTMNLGTSTLIILGDHGHVSSGGHGGTEIEVIQQPIVINGQGITPGQYSLISQTDIAPTVTTLLGVAAPPFSQGRILFELLNLSLQEQALAQMALARQRLELAQAYLTAVVSPETVLPEVLLLDLEQAVTTFSQNNINGAFQLAGLVHESADTQMNLARYNRIQSERWPRLFLGGAVALSWLVIMWRRRNTQAGLILMATLITIALYHILFQLQGYSYSISAFPAFQQLPFDVARRMVVSFLAGGALILVFLMLIDERDWITLLNTGYGFSLLTIFVLSLPLLWAFWQNGLIISWYFPSPNIVFWQVLSLLEILVAAIIGLVLPWPIMLLNVFVNFIRRHLSDNRPEAGRDPLPGLR